MMMKWRNQYLFKTKPFLRDKADIPEWVKLLPVGVANQNSGFASPYPFAGQPMKNLNLMQASWMETDSPCKWSIS